MLRIMMLRIMMLRMIMPLEPAGSYHMARVRSVCGSTSPLLGNRDAGSYYGLQQMDT
jgi:hypothetical protein